MPGYQQPSAPCKLIDNLIYLVCIVQDSATSGTSQGTIRIMNLLSPRNFGVLKRGCRFLVAALLLYGLLFSGLHATCHQTHVISQCSLCKFFSESSIAGQVCDTILSCPLPEGTCLVLSHRSNDWIPLPSHSSRAPPLLT